MFEKLPFCCEIGCNAGTSCLIQNYTPQLISITQNIKDCVISRKVF